MAQSGGTRVRCDLREKKKERQGSKTSAYRRFSYFWTMLIDQREDPLCGRHVIASLSQKGNSLLSTAWSDNGSSSMGSYCKQLTRH